MLEERARYRPCMATNCEDVSAAALAQPGPLLREAQRAFQGVSSPDAVIAYRCGANAASACARNSDFFTEPPCAPVRIGCVAKLLTATLARRAFDDGLLAPDQDAGDVLGRTEGRALGGVTVRQLLDHSHGLDDSQLEAVPRRADTRIDSAALVRALRVAPPLAPPGALYSYGSAGAWLIAALLERCRGRPYSAQIRDDILAPLGILEHDSESTICPATGAAFALDPTDLLRVVAHVALERPNAWPDDRCSGVYGPVLPLPGWNPLERGVHLGWKYHGRGWFGHQSSWPGASLFVRAHPRRALALVVASRSHSAALVAARVFGTHLPELFDLRPPTGRGAAPSCDDSGAFDSAGWHAEIRGGELHVQRRGGRTVQASLRHVGGGVSFTRPAVDSFPHLELFARGESVYLWNGRFVLRRNDAVGQSRPNASSTFPGVPTNPAFPAVT